MIIVSACLLGLKVKYDQTDSNANELLRKYAHLGKYIPLCPEQLGGLTTPRCVSEIKGGSGEDVLAGINKVVTKEGEDVTEQFILGGEQVEKILELSPVTAAILKERSPSCGVNQIYDGTFQHVVKEGQGVTAALLQQHKILIYSEKELTEELLLSLLK